MHKPPFSEHSEKGTYDVALLGDTAVHKHKRGTQKENGDQVGGDIRSVNLSSIYFILSVYL